MKNRTIAFVCALALILGFSSCDEVTTDNISSITYFPNFTVEGSANQVIDCTNTYTEEGVTAEENGQTLAVTETVNGAYFGASSVSVPDVYSITYSATNSEGFDGEVSRNVVVRPCTGDLVDDLSGLYSSYVVRGGAADPQYDGMEYVLIVGDGAGNFQISDAIGGYYDTGRAYGADYAALGGVIAGSGGIFTSPTIGVFPVWGNTVTMTNIIADPVAGTISYNAEGNFGNGNFTVVLTQL